MLPEPMVEPMRRAREDRGRFFEARSSKNRPRRSGSSAPTRRCRSDSVDSDSGGGCWRRREEEVVVGGTWGSSRSVMIRDRVSSMAVVGAQRIAARDVGVVFETSNFPALGESVTVFSLSGARGECLISKVNFFFLEFFKIFYLRTG